MKGPIIGDIVGSIYEWHNIKTKDFPLFAPNCFFTDDSIMTLAVGRAFLNCTDEADFPEELVYQMRLFGHMYPTAATAAGSSSGCGRRIPTPTTASATARPCAAPPPV